MRVCVCWSQVNSGCQVMTQRPGRTSSSPAGGADQLPWWQLSSGTPGWLWGRLEDAVSRETKCWKRHKRGEERGADCVKSVRGCDFCCSWKLQIYLIWTCEHHKKSKIINHKKLQDNGFKNPTSHKLWFGLIRQNDVTKKWKTVQTTKTLNYTET